MLKPVRVTTMPIAIRGVTLIELIAFIVIAGIAMVVLVQVFAVSMRGSHTGKQLTQAVHLAQQRLEVIRGQRSRLGYAGFTATTYDPCPPVGVWAAQVCQTTTYPAGAYQVTSTFNGAADACGAGTGTDCRVVTVTVTEPGGGSTVSVLTTQFWNY